MNLKAFFVATLSSALDLGIAVPDDVVRHVTPDVLATHLPRPLWARLLTACLGAPRVDAQLVVETIGVPNLCEHVPAQIIWDCIQEVARRALSGVVIAAQASAPSSRPHAAAAAPSRPIPLATPPPPPPSESRFAQAPPPPVGPSIPSPGAPGEGEPEAGRRIQPGARFRPTSTGLGRMTAANNARRPQAVAPQPAAPAPAEPARAKRGQTDADFDLETFVGGKDDWKNVLAVEDEQYVDWSATEETATGGDDHGRKR
ncbi:MAG TPA: hypothetical protein VFK02_02565 [Kofleriaceae bacterium]|nr:hypothetical protein [Kofleriaceae bacterium]